MRASAASATQHRLCNIVLSALDLYCRHGEESKSREERESRCMSRRVLVLHSIFAYMAFRRPACLPEVAAEGVQGDCAPVVLFGPLYRRHFSCCEEMTSESFVRAFLIATIVLPVVSTPLETRLQLHRNTNLLSWISTSRLRRRANF